VAARILSVILIVLGIGVIVRTLAGGTAGNEPLARHVTGVGPAPYAFVATSS
jgi:hypothetical protein